MRSTASSASVGSSVQPFFDYPPSVTAGKQMDAAKQRMAAWLKVDAEEVHFGPSTSLNTYVLAQALRPELKPGDEIIVTNQDHEAKSLDIAFVDSPFGLHLDTPAMELIRIRDCIRTGGFVYV